MHDTQVVPVIANYEMPEVEMESIVINVDRKLLTKLLKHSAKKHLSLSSYIEQKLKASMDYEEGVIQCPFAPSGGVCIEALPADAKLPDSLKAVEEKMIARALESSNMTQSKAADLLGIGKSGLNQKMRKLGMVKTAKDVIF
jgi:DNA-binding NtrC family response regulator